MSAKPSTELTFFISEEERAALIGLLTGSPVESHGESRRAETPRNQDQVAPREEILRGLLAKIRSLGR